eukprot:5130725-Prymnesium_polylepis.2
MPSIALRLGHRTTRPLFTSPWRLEPHALYTSARALTHVHSMTLALHLWSTDRGWHPSLRTHTGRQPPLRRRALSRRSGCWRRRMASCCTTRRRVASSRRMARRASRRSTRC